MSRCKGCENADKISGSMSFAVGICMIEQKEKGKGCEAWKKCKIRLLPKIRDD